MKAVIDLEYSEEILKALKPEEITSISSAKVYQSGGFLRLEVCANSISDLRAALNSWLRLIKMCKEIEVLV
ncbi:MAG: KEOPS complex subunit Pcc1 [Archaeoglobaceae archaeon]|nr:KEOPS complex subunit Pcc1 [Archaeoglobaceae archaeon]MDW7989418.1 KEOPS complex subunit Pcc1 [Archaeoglobaceae archaeon]